MIVFHCNEIISINTFIILIFKQKQDLSTERDVTACVCKITNRHQWAKRTDRERSRNSGTRVITHQLSLHDKH